jgi:hypothetical protein
MQRDELCPVLTVSELMLFAANLKLGHHKTLKAKRQLVSRFTLSFEEAVRS